VDAYSAASLELKQDGAEKVIVGASADEADAELELTVSCGPPVEARIVLVSVKTSRVSTRSVRLDDVRPRDRARALALAAAEFVRHEWPALDTVERPPEKTAPTPAPAEKAVPPSAERAETPAPKPSPERAPTTEHAPSKSEPSTPPPSRAREPIVAPRARIESEPDRGPLPEPSPRVGRQAAWSIDAAAEMRWFTDYDSLLLGGAVGARFGRIAARVEGLGAERTTHLGGASTLLFDGNLQWVVWELRTDRLRVGLGPAAALGFSLATGTPDSNVVVHDQLALYGDLRVSAHVGLSFGRVWLDAELEGGRATGAVSFAGREIAGAMAGWLAGAALRAAYGVGSR
jgi:hypothetical protein